MNRRLERSLIVTLAACPLLPQQGTASQRATDGQAALSTQTLQRADECPGRVIFADLPIRPKVESIETIEDLCGVKLRVLGSTGSIEVHYVLEIRCVRRGEEFVCTDYAAVRDDGSIVERRQNHLEADVPITGPASLVWGARALVPSNGPQAGRDLFNFLASESKRACQPGVDRVAPSSPLFAFAFGAAVGQVPLATTGLPFKPEQLWLNSGIRRFSVLEQEFETDSMGFLRVRNAVVCGPDDVEQRAVYSLARVPAANRESSSPYCPEADCGRLAIVTFFGLLYLCNDSKGACKSLDTCKCMPKTTQDNQPANRGPEGALHFELKCVCQMETDK